MSSPSDSRRALSSSRPKRRQLATAPSSSSTSIIHPDTPAPSALESTSTPAPKRPPNAFFIFKKSWIASAGLPRTIGQPKRNSLAASVRRELPQQVKAYYEELAAVLMAEHRLRYPNFKYHSGKGSKGTTRTKKAPAKREPTPLDPIPSILVEAPVPTYDTQRYHCSPLQITPHQLSEYGDVYWNGYAAGDVYADGYQDGYGFVYGLESGYSQDVGGCVRGMQFDDSQGYSEEWLDFRFGTARPRAW